MRSVLHTLHEHLGATFGEFGGSELPRDYADPIEEYRAVREGVGLIDRADQAQIRMWGRDPVKMLHGLITNDLLNAPAGRGVYAAMLTPKGRVLAELRAFSLAGPEGTEVLIDLPREALSGSTEHLRKFVPPLFARWSVAEQSTCLGVYGPRAHELLTRTAEGVPELQEDEFARALAGGIDVLLVGTRYAGDEPGYDVFVETSAVEALWKLLTDSGGDLGVHAVGHSALETLRIEAGRPRFGRELTEETIPTEAFESTGMMERAISFTKGCYTGQEVIVRIAHRGHVNRHLRGIRLGDAAAPLPGARLFRMDAEKDVGWITSVADSPLVGETIGLGYVRREISPGDRVRVSGVGGAEAIVTTLPFTKEA